MGSGPVKNDNIWGIALFYFCFFHSPIDALPTLSEAISGPSVTPRSSGFGGGSGPPRASGSAVTPRGGGGYPGGVTPGGSTPRSV